MLASIHKCPYKCRTRFDEGMFVPTGNPYPDNVLISGEWAFHMQDSHGIPVDIYPEILSEMIYRA